MSLDELLAALRRRRFAPAAWRDLGLHGWRVARAEALARPAALRSLALTGLGGLLVLLLVASGPALTGRGALALLLLRDGAVALLLGLAGLAAGLGLLRDDTGRPLERINLANLLTLSRLVSIPLFWRCFEAQEPAAALLVFGVGALTDVADGLVARLGRQRTPFGRLFDPAVDILFNAMLFAALGRAGLIPPWVLLLVAIRYGLLVLGSTAIALLHGPVEIRPTVVGKTAGVVTTLLLVALTAGLLLPGAAGTALRHLSPLVVLTVGLVEALTLPQVVLIGWLNVRRHRAPSPATGLRLVELEDVEGKRRRGV